jgi:hypothetical protein
VIGNKGNDRSLARFAAKLVLTFRLFLGLVLTCCPGVAFSASPEGSHRSAEASGSAAPRSAAAEAWDAVKDTKNPALLKAFIKRYGSSFFAEIAKARLDELKAAAVKPTPRQTTPTDRAQSLQMPTDGVRESAVLYEEDPSDPKGQQFAGSVIWRTEAIKADGKPDELAARADVDIPSRGLRMRILLKRNLDPSLPASHVIELTFATPADFHGGRIANVPGVLMKSNQQARGTPMAGIAVKVTDGFFLDGLSDTPADRARNLGLLLERAWFDIPLVYSNQQRAIVAIEKGGSGEGVFKTVFTAWGKYPNSTQHSAQPEPAKPPEPDYAMPEEWKRSMTGRPKAQ